MIDRYSSLAGIVQIIFVVSLAILVVRRWDELGPIMKIIILIGLSLFTIIQPLAFWINAKKSIDPNMPETELKFDDDNMVIKVNSNIQRIRYENLVQVIKKPKMLIIQPDRNHIYILPDRVLNGDKKELFEYLKTKLS